MAIPTVTGNVAQKCNINWRRGDSLDLTLEYYSDEAQTIPLDLTGATFKLHVVDLKSNKKKILVFEDTKGLTFEAPNKIILAKTSDEMKVDAGHYYYDLERTIAGKVLTLQEGEFTIVDDRT
jgi:hypothetical protein